MAIKYKLKKPMKILMPKLFPKLADLKKAFHSKLKKRFIIFGSFSFLKSKC